MPAKLRECVFVVLLIVSAAALNQSARANCAEEDYITSDICIIDLDVHDYTENFTLAELNTNEGELNVENIRRRAESAAIANFISEMAILRRQPRLRDLFSPNRCRSNSFAALLQVIDGKLGSNHLVPSTVGSSDQKLVLAYSTPPAGSTFRAVMFADGSFGATSSREEFQRQLRYSVEGRFRLDISLAASASVCAQIVDLLKQLADDDMDVRDEAMKKIESCGMRALGLVTLGAYSSDPEQRARCTNLIHRFQLYWKVKDQFRQIANDVGLQLPVQEAEIKEFPCPIRFHDGVAEVLGQSYSLEDLRKTLPAVHSGLVAMAAAPGSR